MQRTVKIPLLRSVTSVHYISPCQKVLYRIAAGSKLDFLFWSRYLVLKGLDRAESSDIHGFVAHAWDVKCPSIRKMGASLWISDVIFFPALSLLLHAPPVGSLSEMPLAKVAKMNFFSWQTKILWKQIVTSPKKCQQIELSNTQRVK